MNKIQEEIFRSIENITSKNSTPIVYDIPAVILGVDRGKYKVNIDGAERTVKDGIGLNLTVGTPVWLHAMNGDMSQLYVISKR